MPVKIKRSESYKDMSKSIRISFRLIGIYRCSLITLIMSDWLNMDVDLDSTKHEQVHC